MSLTVSNIKRRWADLCRYRKQGLEARNASEHYEKDVGDLLKITEVLMKTCCQMNIKMHEAQGKPIREFKVYWDTFDNAVERLLTKKFLVESDNKKPGINLEIH